MFENIIKEEDHFPLMLDISNSQESESSPVMTESNKKRVVLGLLIGGILFVGLVIAIVLLIANAGVKYKPIPPKPKERKVSYNPYELQSYHEEGTTSARAILFNNRTKLEEVTSQPYSNLGAGTPNVSNTSYNFEPNLLVVDFIQIDEHLLNVKYRDAENERWEVPKFHSDDDPYSFVSNRIRAPLGLGPMREGGMFWWRFYGKNLDISPLITTEYCRLQYFDKYIEFEARLQTNNIYGMGERVESFSLKNSNYSLWSSSVRADGDSYRSSHGCHPFFLNKLKDKNGFIGVFMRNSNAMLFSFWNVLNNGTFINYKMIGGIVDLYLIHAADPDYILKKYHNLIGRPYLPPVWAMGMQQARSGYTLKDIKDVVSKTQSLKLPMDAIYADIEINEDGKAFTINQNNFKEIKEYVHTLHDHAEGIDMKFVAIANPGIKVEKGYKYYDKAVTDNCLINSARNLGHPFEGKTYAGKTVWLDYFTHEAILVLADGLHDYHSLCDFDGIWIRENEPSHQCDGECQNFGYDNGIPNPYHNESEFDYLFFRPTIDTLDTSTLPMSAYHCCSDKFNKQYNTHNLFGLQSTKAAHEVLESIFEDKRFLVLSRSTWPGSGHYGSHLIDQIFGDWKVMQTTIPNILNFNIFGIPHVGAPIGGYYGKVDRELFIRWIGLSAFSPLMISYSNSAANPKEAYIFGDAVEIVRRIMTERYSLLRFMYTKMFESFAWGGAVVHPLFFEFPDDPNCYDRDVTDKSFMWGKTLYVIPAILKGQESVKAYLPNWRWYEMGSNDMIRDYGDIGDFYYFKQPLGQVTVLIKGGSIIPYQNMSYAAKVMNVEDLKLIPALLIIAPDHTGKASGTMVIDGDGIKPHPDPLSNTYRHYSFTYMNQIFRINKLAGFDFHEFHEMDYFWELIILDIFAERNVEFVCMMDSNMHKKELRHTFANRQNSLIIHDENMGKMLMSSLESIVWGNRNQHNFCKFDVRVTNIQYVDEGKTMQATLQTIDPNSYQLRFNLGATILTNQIISLQISMSEPGKEQWIVPGVVDDSVRKTITSNKLITESGFRITKINEPFAFSLGDPGDSRDFIFTTKNSVFDYVRNYMHIKFMANTRHIFGLGERTNKFELEDGIYSIFNFDHTSVETGMPPGNNMMGSHPFYLMHLHDPNFFAGVFFLNSNPIDIKIQHVGMQTQIHHIFIGGIIDAFLFNKAKIDEVIKNYHYVIGKPAPFPYWAFGFHQCRWGYRGIEHIQDVERKFALNDIPIDGLWIDKDYMYQERDFTLDKSWIGLKKFVDQIHTRGLHFVALVNPGLGIFEDYQPYKEGLQKDLFIKSSFTNKPLIGVTWPGYSVFIDFTHPSSDEFWEHWLMEFFKMVEYDGLWLDMNEPSSFCDGECPDGIHYIYYNFPLDFYDDLYYNPTHRPLESKSISMEAVHYKETNEQPEFNYHNLFGLLHSRMTARLFRNKFHKRPFILSSSTFPSSGRHVGHWLGDNYASWHWMEYSISGIFNFQMFGIPFVGADIGGFNGDATIPLVCRWMQLAAFYPMMRHHFSKNSKPREPYVDPILAGVTRSAIRTRYSLARYLYTLHMRTSLFGGLYFKPLLFEFPADDQIYSYLNQVIMLGHAIRLTPVLQDKVTVLETYFPNHDWYEFPSMMPILRYNSSAKHGKNISLPCSLESEKINIHIKGGSIFTYQEESHSNSIIRIEKMQDYPVQLVIAPFNKSRAIGYVYYDNDITINMYQGEYKHYTLELLGNVMNVTFEGSATYKYEKKDETVSHILVLNAGEYSSAHCAKLYDITDRNYHNLNTEYIPAKEMLKISPPEGYTIAFSKLGNVSWYSSTTC